VGSRVGVISDTHGLLRPEAVCALSGVDYIVHAGDVGSANVLEALSQLAPVTAVRGNSDKGFWAEALPATELLEVESCFLYILHELEHLDLDPVAAGFHAIITGHSHEPSAEFRNGVLYLNPGSAGPRRFELPIALALLSISARMPTVSVSLVESRST
jgi:putative phosphoesterase